MEKSFYHVVNWNRANDYRVRLKNLNIPFGIAQEEKLSLSIGQVAFIFPDLPIRIYGQVHELFKSHGRKYP